MERHDVEDIVEEYITARGGSAPRPDLLMPMRPFKAVSTDRTAVEVIGVGYEDEMLQFLVIEEADGEIWPQFKERVFRTVNDVPPAYDFTPPALISNSRASGGQQ